jgi:hypothetical protein
MINLKSHSGSIDVFLVSDHSHGQLQQGVQAGGATSSASLSSSSSSSASASTTSSSVKSEPMHPSASDALMGPATNALGHGGNSFIKADSLGKADSALSRAFLAPASQSRSSSSVTASFASSSSSSAPSSSSSSSSSSSLHQYPCPPILPFLQPHSPALAASSFGGHHSPATSTLRHPSSFSPLSQHLNHAGHASHSNLHHQATIHASHVHPHAHLGGAGTLGGGYSLPFGSSAAFSVARP